MMKKKDVVASDPRLTFKPQLNEKSLKISQSKQQSIDRKSHYDRLIEAGKKV